MPAAPCSAESNPWKPGFLLPRGDNRTDLGSNGSSRQEHTASQPNDGILIELSQQFFLDVPFCVAVPNKKVSGRTSVTLIYNNRSKV